VRFGEGDSVCISSFFGSELDSETGLILGNSLLRRWYSIFDKENGRIGLAEAIRSDASFRNLTSSVDSLVTETSLKQSSSPSSVISSGSLIALWLITVPR
jgi:hypothetical protein